MGQPHKHAELIKAWAENQSIVLQTKDDTGQWVDCLRPGWFDTSEYRIKPELPKYPQTSYSETTLACICHNNGTKKPSLTDVANMAIARAILDGDVVPAAMLEKVASLALEAGRKSVIYRDEKKPNGIPYESVIVEINLQEIIEKAKGGA